MNKNWLLLLFLVLAASCSASKKAQRQAAKMDVTELEKRWELNRFNPEFFSAKIKVQSSVNGKKEMPLVANLRMVKDSLIWISLSPATGVKIEVARALITPDSLKLLDKINKQYYPRSFDYIYNFIDYPINFTDLQNLIYGAYFPPCGFENLSVDSLRYNLSKENCLMAIEPIAFTIEKMLVEEKTSEGSFLVKQHKPLKTEQGWIPEERTYELNADRFFRLKLIFNKLSFEQELTFPFKVSSKYEKVD